jgi:hypothetical protein
MQTFNTRSLQMLAEKIKQKRAIFAEECFDGDVASFPRFKGLREGLQIALDLIEDVEKEMNS